MSAPANTPFGFTTPLSFFEKAGAPSGQSKRIGVLLSTENEDLEGHEVLTKGVDYSYWLEHGWFNDNHSKSAGGVIGYPTEIKTVAKGEILPDGKASPGVGTWAEGYLIPCPDAEKIWERAVALEQSGAPRRIGASLEGDILQKQDNGRTVSKAIVYQVAITHCPKNPDTRFAALVKSLSAGSCIDAPSGPISGDGAGRVLTTEDLPRGKKKKRVTKEVLAKSLSERFPGVAPSQIGQLVELVWRAAA